MNQTKAELRNQTKRARLELTDAEHTLKSRAIVQNLKQVIDWSKVSSLHYFEPFQQLLEPNISPFISYLEDSYPALKLYMPRLINNSWELIAIKGGDLPKQFDVVFVPMLAFDDNLQRIGYGGGYYDRFLATQLQANKIGVCFELGRVDHIPAEPYDIILESFGEI
jgi:5-formyltetrahydrofolate cyclo-ligase